MRKYLVNDNFFQKVDSEKVAYVLGFLYADGNVYNNVISCCQVERDKDIIYLIRKLLDSDYPIRKDVQNRYNLAIRSKQISLDLIRLGCLPCKSLILQFPRFLSDALMPHFIRGLFDVDGCIWEGKRKKMPIKDNSCKSGKRIKTIQNVKFTYTGNVDFVTSLQDYLILKLGLSKTKLNFSKAKNPNNNTCDRVCTMEYSGRRNIKLLYDYMYTNATYYGIRKNLKFKKICALDK